ncbi:electron transport complex subunit RsxG [Niveibacterium umoris]|uniref:Ion-translocating oxidoreductase complex subunit G n=1 Tax=Niveibacterium umoris TaxID=1193620 RepID=A0A840BGZ5_9RHOO|nr:electron transport complex subunit RsxG [Niveibacterium umoris]MBB4011933.1 electron transport complex protein RnfG [Niveibacterium umoris]
MSEHSAGGLSVRSALAMVVFTVVFTAVMAAVYLLTLAPIARSAKAEKLLLIDQILPRELYDNALLDDVLALPATPELGLEQGGKVWRARRGGQPAAIVIEAVAPDGYSGNISLIVAVSADGHLLGTRVTEHRETPGLGDYIDPKKDKNKAHPWIAQFEGKSADLPPTAWSVKKDGGVFDYSTGATISPRAVTHAVGRVVAYVSAHRDTLFR